MQSRILIERKSNMREEKNQPKAKAWKMLFIYAFFVDPIEDMSIDAVNDLHAACWAIESGLVKGIISGERLVNESTFFHKHH